MHNTLKSVTPKKKGDKFSSEFLNFIYYYRGLSQGFNDSVFVQQIVLESQNLYTQETRSCKGWIKLQEHELFL